MNDSTPVAPSTETSATAGRRRRVLLAAILGIFAIGGIAYGTYWFAVARYVVSTEDAYVAGNIVPVTPQVAGIATAIGADETQLVHAGQMLVELDRADTHATLARHEAQLAGAVREIRNLFVRSAQLRAAIKAREVEVARSRSDLARREKLAKSGAVSSEDIQHAREALRAAQAGLDEVRAQLAGNEVLIDGTTVANHPRVRNAAAQLRTAYLDYERTIIPAPVSGIVAKRNVQLGQRVSPGAPLMAVVPLSEVWVDANFKEGQLHDIRAGQPVTLVADANDFEYHGTVVGLGAGTGAAFSLLPPQNATGNWIKIVQRLPVRIALDPKELAAHPLQIGLSIEVRVDVHDKGNAAPQRVHQSAPAYRTNVFENQERDVDALIARIIAENDSDAAGRLAQTAQHVAH
jgi:membrane fusion protein (multidrug efflux system)